MKFLMTFFLFIALTSFSQNLKAADVDPSCDDANMFENVITQICWDCFLEGINLLGGNVGNVPDGARVGPPVCSCDDELGVPEFGFPLGYWAPTKLNEVVTTPWCSPALGGIKLQDTMTGLGANNMTPNTQEESASAFFQYHYFSYPLMTMLDMLTLPSCTDGYLDFDLMYVSEIDPLWNNDMLALILNPEAIIFNNPVAMAWCALDCVNTTADNQEEASYGCAGCDGMLYPFTGNVTPNIDPVASSSLITQRVLASLHRKGLAHKTIGSEAMCEPEFYPTIPRTQYKFSMIYPIAEANSNPTPLTSSQAGGAFGTSILSDGYASGSDATNATNTNNFAGSAGDQADIFGSCCHPMGMSTSRWCTPSGGRMRPGMDNAFLYVVFNYRDCCVRGQ